MNETTRLRVKEVSYKKWYIDRRGDGQGVSVGYFEFVTHPDDCPQGRWEYYSAPYPTRQGNQPTGEWVEWNTPRDDMPEWAAERKAW